MGEPAKVDEGQWKTSCPLCNCDRLLVTEVTLVATGEVIHPGTVLQPDGFIVDPDNERTHLKDQSTDNEVVMCPRCRSFFTLTDLVNQ